MPFSTGFAPDKQRIVVDENGQLTVNTDESSITEGATGLQVKKPSKIVWGNFEDGTLQGFDIINNLSWSGSKSYFGVDDYTAQNSDFIGKNLLIDVTAETGEGDGSSGDVIARKEMNVEGVDTLPVDYYIRCEQYESAITVKDQIKVDGTIIKELVGDFDQTKEASGTLEIDVSSKSSITFEARVYSNNWDDGGIGSQIIRLDNIQQKTAERTEYR